MQQDRSATHLSVSDDVCHFLQEARQDESLILILSTRLLFCRDGGAGIQKSVFVDDQAQPTLFISAMELRDETNAEVWRRLSERLRHAEANAWQQMRSKTGSSNWFYLESDQDIAAGEKYLLAGTGKSQDGLVARLINRPISRSVSKLLVRFPLSPNKWTLLLTAIPIAGAIFLIQGHYLGIAIGAALFQFHSTLDGCDGEIARLKYQESARGSKLDAVCDRVATLIYAVALGIGLSRQPDIPHVMQWIYPLEGIVTALLIGIGESLLTRVPISEMSQITTAPDNRYHDYVTRHASSFNPGDHLKLWIINHSKILFLGEWATALFSQLTKRDVFNLGFMLLALCGQARWILHILAGVAGAILILGLKNLFAKRLPKTRAAVRAAD